MTLSRAFLSAASSSSSLQLTVPRRRGPSLGSGRRQLAPRVLDRHHRRDRPTHDLLRRLLDPVRSVVDRVVDVHYPFREGCVARLTAADKLRKTVRRAAERCEPASQLLRFVDEAALFGLGVWSFYAMYAAFGVPLRG